MSFLIRNKVPKLIFGRYIGMSLDGRVTNLYSCSTKQIVAAYKTRLIATGVTVGSTKCLSNYVNNLTGTSKAECITTAYKLRLQALGVVTGPTTCLTNYITNLTGE